MSIFHYAPQSPVPQSAQSCLRPAPGRRVHFSSFSAEIKDQPPSALEKQPFQTQRKEPQPLAVHNDFLAPTHATVPYAAYFEGVLKPFQR